MNLKHLYWKIPYNWRLGQLWYHLKCYLWHRYTTVKPRYLDHTWCDRCAMMPHMMFEILSQFIEKECLPGHVEWYGEYGHKVDGVYVRDEMQELYDWWHLVYNKACPEVNELLWESCTKYKPIETWVSIDNEYDEYAPTWASEEDKEFYHLYLDAINKLEAKMEQELQANLRKIIPLIPYMWT